MKPTKPIKSSKFKNKFVYNDVFGVDCGVYELNTITELADFIKEKSNNSYSIVKFNNNYLLVLKVCGNKTLISIIKGNQNCIDDIINL